MAISNRNQGDICIVDLSGDIDGNTAPDISSEVLKLAESNNKIILDLTKVPYMSSAGLRILLKVYRTIIANESAKLVLVGLSEEIADTMKITGFLDFFTTSDTLEKGLIAINQVSEVKDGKN